MPSARRHKFIVYCSEDALDLASEVFDGIAAAFAVSINVLPASVLRFDHRNLMTGWGIFTPGAKLSEAAYYRIFAAQLLGRDVAEGRALYLDSDVLVSGDIDSLLGFDLKGKPLGARREDPTLEGIRRAAGRLGIGIDEYFNSGVLLFDLEHPQLMPALERSIEVALHDQNKLTHLDQCALNLGFRSQVAELPPEFNFFVREESDPRAHGVEAAVWHFVQWPKPWDPAYASENCAGWLKALVALGKIAAPDKLRRLLSPQFAHNRAAAVEGSADA